MNHCSRMRARLAGGSGRGLARATIACLLLLGASACNGTDASLGGGSDAAASSGGSGGSSGGTASSGGTGSNGGGPSGGSGSGSSGGVSSTSSSGGGSGGSSGASSGASSGTSSGTSSGAGGTSSGSGAPHDAGADSGCGPNEVCVSGACFELTDAGNYCPPGWDQYQCAWPDGGTGIQCVNALSGCGGPTNICGGGCGKAAVPRGTCSGGQGFACGPSVFCDPTTEYCLHSQVGPITADGSVSIAYSCAAPPGCAPVSCSCITTTAGYTCSETSGEVTVTFHGQ
jgi:hypothetical protein